MATYIDVAALVGIKISTSGALSTNGSTYTVPSGSYAEVSVIAPGTGQSDNNIMLMKVVPAGGVITRTDASSISISGVSLSISNAVINYVVFTNNQ